MNNNFHHCSRKAMNSMWRWLYGYRKTPTKHSWNVKRDECVEDFLQCFVWFVKQVFHILCFALFREERRFLHETSTEFCEILSKGVASTFFIFLWIFLYCRKELRVHFLSFCEFFFCQLRKGKLREMQKVSRGHFVRFSHSRHFLQNDCKMSAKGDKCVAGLTG